MIEAIGSDYEKQISILKDRVDDLEYAVARENERCWGHVSTICELEEELEKYKGLYSINTLEDELKLTMLMNIGKRLMMYELIELERKIIS